MLNWTSDSNQNQIIHSASVSETSESVVRHGIEASVDKAIQLLKQTIQDDSLYLLFEWDMNNATLNIIVTDASKTRDSLESVHCVFSSLAIELARESEEQRLAYVETIKFWLHDYLSLCTAFFNYSLVAIFCSNSRSNSELL